jgi:hypothetical protein
VSFHEFVLAIGSVEQLNVRSSLAMYLHQARLKRHPWLRIKPQWLTRPPWLWRSLPLDHRYRSLLAEISPSIHPGFFERQLELIFQKPQ